MADRTSWWKAFTFRKKGGTVSRDPAMVQQDSTTETQSVEPTTPADSSKSSTDSSTDNSRLIQNGTYDDSECEPAFDVKTNLRNMSISRSGRFKERRKNRLTLAENNNFYAGTRAAAGQEGLR